MASRPVGDFDTSSKPTQSCTCMHWYLNAVIAAKLSRWWFAWENSWSWRWWGLYTNFDKAIWRVNDTHSLIEISSTATQSSFDFHRFPHMIFLRLQRCFVVDAKMYDFVDNSYFSYRICLLIFRTEFDATCSLTRTVDSPSVKIRLHGL
jgi:hypothetical protein